ncbi:MAG: hypothetical protein WCO72_14605 [Betaproteobacteria bacterium]
MSWLPLSRAALAQLTLWKLISGNVWFTFMAQVKLAAAKKAQAALASNPKKFKPKKVIPKRHPLLKDLYPYNKDR